MVGSHYIDLSKKKKHFTLTTFQPNAVYNFKCFQACTELRIISCKYPEAVSADVKSEWEAPSFSCQQDTVQMLDYVRMSPCENTAADYTHDSLWASGQGDDVSNMGQTQN